MTRLIRKIVFDVCEKVSKSGITKQVFKNLIIYREDKIRHLFVSVTTSNSKFRFDIRNFFIRYSPLL